MTTTARFNVRVIESALGLLIVLVAVAPRACADDSAIRQPAGRQDSRQQSDDLLRRARQAIKEDDLEAAATLISQAEALQVRYGPLHLGDTPEKARRDLERKLGEGKAPKGLGQLFSPLRGKNTPLATDPFAEHNKRLAGEIPIASAGPANPTRAFGTQDGTSLKPLPPIGVPVRHVPAGPSGEVPAPGSRLGSILSPQRLQSDRLLHEARRALAFGDVRTATERIRQARQLNVPYAASDDTPEKVEALVGAYARVMALRAEQGDTQAFRHQFARLLTEQAQGLLRWGDYDEAERLAELAGRQGAVFGPFEVQPKKLLEQIAAERKRAATTADSAAPQAAHLMGRSRAALTAGETAISAREGRSSDAHVSRAVYDSYNDPTRNVLAADQQLKSPSVTEPVTGPRQPTVPTPAPAIAAGNSDGPFPAPPHGMSLFQQGEEALKDHDAEKALDYFRQAADHRNELDPMTDQRLQERLQMLSVAAQPKQTGSGPSLLDDAAAKRQALLRKVLADVTQQEASARQLTPTDPKAALAELEETRRMVESSGLDEDSRGQLLRRIDRSLEETRRLIEENRPRIELDEQNRRVRDQLEREQELKLDLQKKIASMVEEYNRLMEQQQYLAAEVVAKRAAELDPENEVTRQLVLNAKFIRRYHNNAALASDKEESFLDAMEAVDKSSKPFDDMVPYVFNRDATEWKELVERRSKLQDGAGRRRSERELEIEKKLQTPVLLQFENTPLSQVMDYLAKLAGVNLYLDPQGLAEEGISSDDPVTIRLSQEIRLKSALNLILRERHLSYVIKDEVLKITSEQLRDGEVYTQTYNVADLVIPVPNFVPSAQMGLGGALRDAMAGAGYGGGPFGGSSMPLAVVANREGVKSSPAINAAVLAQQMPSGGPTSGMGPGGMPIGYGPGGMGGGAMADFDSLIELITTTVQPTTWDTVGGPGSIAPFETNLSLVISQTQEVHEEIVDLLAQLRRMQDLQVTIEVRFITLNDNFFERLGVDFDFDIDDDIDDRGGTFGQIIVDDDADPAEEPNRDTRDVDHDPSVTIGMGSPGVFSADLDIPFTQNSFGLAIPQFGGFDATAGAQLGFAILSDIEAFFFINAAQGDRRSNVMQAPKVTLFNGQLATVSDTSQSPFVISVIPVVGDFAAAQQPVIVVLNEGTFLTVQAVVSDDRRFVRLTVVPYFSRIGEVNEFTFEGSETTTANSSQQGIQDEPNDNTRSSRDTTVTRQGTTVQLPTFSFVTVSTTVSVPDGGTVLLGGIKRLSEGRNEFGVPILNKIPYVNRLFKNVGIGRETQSLMMMVTPRIIIQEEEEEKLGIVTE